MTRILADPYELLAQHRGALGECAKKVILRGESLSAHEEEDRERRIEEFLAICGTLKLTEKEAVALIFRGVLAEKRGCGCPTCRLRIQMN